MIAKNPQPEPADRRFPLGRIVGTPAALAALEAAGQAPMELLRRHLAGDWGEVDDEDRRANEQAVLGGTRVLSAYTLKTGIRVWIITEADRSTTTILLPSDY